MSDLPKILYDEAMKWEGGSPFGLLVRAGDRIAELERQLAEAKAYAKLQEELRRGMAYECREAMSNKGNRTTQSGQ